VVQLHCSGVEGVVGIGELVGVALPLQLLFSLVFRKKYSCCFCASPLVHCSTSV